MGLIEWCDTKITELKQNGIEFINGLPQIPLNMVYEEIPEFIETYQFRNEIPKNKRKKALICFYSLENRLWKRLETIEKDCIIFREFAGIVEMDFSPSVLMLKSRQIHSILINKIYDCLIAIRGIKVAVNARIGDFSTIHLIYGYPKEKTIVFGNLGCKGKFLIYSYRQFKEWIKIENPKNICLYGTLSKRDIIIMEKMKIRIVINLYNSHNFRTDYNIKNVFAIDNNKYIVNNPRQGYVLDYILSHNIPKNNSICILKEESVKNHGC